jgi:hypothetical protein
VRVFWRWLTRLLRPDPLPRRPTSGAPDQPGLRRALSGDVYDKLLASPELTSPVKARIAEQQVRRCPDTAARSCSLALRRAAHGSTPRYLQAWCLAPDGSIHPPSQASHTPGPVTEMDIFLERTQSRRELAVVRKELAVLKAAAADATAAAAAAEQPTLARASSELGHLRAAALEQRMTTELEVKKTLCVG